MSLIDDLTERRREISTDAYGMSIGEIISMRRDGDIDIHPEFQRIFRWTPEQKSRLIESILLGIPVPPIFVSQREDGVWDVIDGVQRLSTILEFVGEYRDEGGNLGAPLVLQSTEYLSSLDGYTYDSDSGLSFDDALRRDFKRSKMDFIIIKKESDDNAKYDLFQRLNSGTHLSPQEARNCLLVMLDRTFYQFLVELSEYPHFRNTVLLSDRKEDEGFRQELVIRFLIQAEYEDDERQLPKDLGDFVSDWSRTAAGSVASTREKWRRSFVATFDVLDAAVGDDAFRRWDGDKQRFLGPFSISAYEAITSGVAATHESWNERSHGELEQRIQDMWNDPEFRDKSGVGMNARKRLPLLVSYGRRFFA